MSLPVYHVQAVAGDAVFLPCDISITDDLPAHQQGTQDAVLLVLWYREDLGTPIYSVDARERDFKHAEKWSDEHVFSNRAYFMPERRPAQLGVDNVRESDAGMYRCRVDFKIAQTRNSKVNLTVVGDENDKRITQTSPYGLDNKATKLYSTSKPSVKIL
ncbi:uncharacterized protein LOC142325737 [Lycorma delicatula]|uniref:uncharacterized protein LOC142325737 n=1 Tax=Lycorma delicatula TaxID=130591 RepID=UPI003F511082